MAIFVGSDNNDSKIRDNRVGLAISTSNPSSPDTGDAYYNSTDNKLTVYNGSDWASAGGGGTIEMVASGALSNGATVIINTDGTVSTVGTTSVASTFGTIVDYRSTQVSAPSAVYDSTSGKVVIAYSDNDDSQHGKAIVGTVSGTSISFGTPVEFESAYIASQTSIVFDSTNNRVVISYRDAANSNYGTAVVGYLFGTNSISFGSATVFETSLTSYISSAYDSSSGKVIISYRDWTDSNKGKAVVGTVSGISISFGTPVVFETGSTTPEATVYDSVNNKTVIFYSDGGDGSKGKAIVGTVSGTSISFGSAVVFNDASTTYFNAGYDSTNGKIVVAYKDSNGKSVVGTVSGTSISFGSAVTFESGASDYFQVGFDSTNGKVVIAYRDTANSNHGTVAVGSVSGTSISFGTPTVFDASNTTTDGEVVFDSTNNKVVIVYTNGGSPYNGKAVVVNTLGGLVTTLTAENYIGFSDAAYSDGATAKIQIEGSVDDAQTGLTTAKVHYVQNDGSLSTTAGNPLVEAGTAISSTQIIVKG